MKELQDRILKDGVSYPGGIVKVDSFLNHMMDTALIDNIGKEFYEHYKDCGITKIVTVEASGIGIACLTARHFGVPVVFAKKGEAKNISDNTYSTEVMSYTRGRLFTVRIDKRYLTRDDRVLIIDDFLATGEAVIGLKNIVDQSGAVLCGVGICVEKAFQNGGKILRDMGIDLCSLARVDVDDNGKILIVD